jgi:hypothetical protein
VDLIAHWFLCQKMNYFWQVHTNTILFFLSFFFPF